VNCKDDRRRDDERHADADPRDDGRARLGIRVVEQERRDRRARARARRHRSRTGGPRAGGPHARLAQVPARRPRPPDGLAPDERATRRDEHERPRQRVGEGQADLAEGQQQRHHEAADAERDLEGGTPVARGAQLGRGDRRRRVGPLGRHEHPGQDVGHEAEAAGERRRAEDDPQQQRIDVQAPAQPLADAGDHAVLRIAPQVAQ
jgi:hypothetical protein